MKAIHEVTYPRRLKMQITRPARKFQGRPLPLFVAVSMLALGHSAFAQAPVDKAWTVLQTGLADKTTEERVIAVRVLGLLENDPKAPGLALNALADGKPEVRAAAADALGLMKAKSAAPKLGKVILSDEKDVGVILACARSMIELGDDRGYGVYYAVLTGDRKNGGGLLDDQKKMLHDPKKMAQFGFEQGIGFIPFGGLGYGAFKAFSKDDESPVRAAAAKVLTKDPDPKSGMALVDASSDKSWIVRMAALDSLARRGDASSIPQIESKLDDEKDVVRYTAAGAIIHLSELRPLPLTSKLPVTSKRKSK
jgi:HEAT repeat protein